MNDSEAQPASDLPGAKPFKPAEAEDTKLVSSDSGDFRSATNEVPMTKTLNKVESEVEPQDKGSTANSLSPLRVSSPPKKQASSSPGANSYRVSKSLIKGTTATRLAKVLSGLLFAAVAGSCANFVATMVGDQFFAPQYVQDFRRAAHMQDWTKALPVMREAIATGEKVEPRSERLIKTTHSFGRQLFKHGQWIEAKDAFAKAAVPVGYAAPDFRELQRSFITDEANAEHAAFQTKLKDTVDEKLLDTLKQSATIFEESSVARHQTRAASAHLALGQLDGDAGQFYNAKTEIDAAEVLNGSFGSLSKSDFARARWLVEMQSAVALMTTHAAAPDVEFLPGEVAPGAREDKILWFLANGEYEKLDALFEKEAVNRRQYARGLPFTAYMTEHLALIPANARVQDQDERLAQLNKWATARPASPWALITLATFYNLQANYIVGKQLPTDFSDGAQNNAYAYVYKSAQELLRALRLGTSTPIDPSWIFAAQANLANGEQISRQALPDEKVFADLIASSIHAQPALHEVDTADIMHRASRGQITQEQMVKNTQTQHAAEN